MASLATLIKELRRVRNDYGTFTVTLPDDLKEITPNHVHIQTELLLSAGMFLIITVGDPGAQGAVVTGTQGACVTVPSDEAMMAITAGFVGALHITKDGILTIGLLSIMFAAGIPLAFTAFVGKTLSGIGAEPKVHCIKAPVVTSSTPIRLDLSLSYASLYPAFCNIAMPRPNSTITDTTVILMYTQRYRCCAALLRRDASCKSVLRCERCTSLRV